MFDKEPPFWLIIIILIPCLIAFGFLVGNHSYNSYENYLSDFFTALSAISTLASIGIMVWIFAQWKIQNTQQLRLEIIINIVESLHNSFINTNNRLVNIIHELQDLGTINCSDYNDFSECTEANKGKQTEREQYKRAYQKLYTDYLKLSALTPNDPLCEKLYDYIKFSHIISWLKISQDTYENLAQNKKNHFGYIELPYEFNKTNIPELVKNTLNNLSPIQTNNLPEFVQNTIKKHPWDIEHKYYIELNPTTLASCYERFIHSLKEKKEELYKELLKNKYVSNADVFRLSLSEYI